MSASNSSNGNNRRAQEQAAITFQSFWPGESEQAYKDFFLKAKQQKYVPSAIQADIYKEGAVQVNVVSDRVDRETVIKKTVQKELDLPTGDQKAKDIEDTTPTAHTEVSPVAEIKSGNSSRKASNKDIFSFLNT